jgi:hypothetical protein
MAVFEVAFHLKKTVKELSESISYDEFLGWLNYFERRPVDWRADDRASKHLQAQGVKEKPWVLFPSLNAIYHPPSEELEEGKVALKGTGVLAQLLTATGGHVLGM